MDRPARRFEQVYCTGDAAHSYIGDETKKLDGTSPANLRVTTVGDELRYANNGQSKVIAISGKDRGAILLAGKRGTAYMYMDKSGRFASSTYYMKEHPAWHDALLRGQAAGQVDGPVLDAAAAGGRLRALHARGPALAARTSSAAARSFPFTLPRATSPRPTTRS